MEKTKEEWMAGISHDLRTPLSTMQGYGVLLESGQYDWSKEELMEIGQTIHEKSNYMLNLIEDFSLSFQLKNKPGQIIFEKTEMNQFLKEILKNYQRDKTLAYYTFHFKGLNQSAFLSINQKLFKRMIDNLIYNAIKHNPKGTIIWVYLEKDQEKNMLTITIEDNGIGMDKETLKHLFTRYYRGTNTDEKSDGTGLGMSIAKQIADLHKGMISVQSEKNKGTTVTIQFKYE
ncbi:sensor histidine kinase [Ureibacillus thermophilus]|uniref:histidine kinase n=1 Tax=Ureibacillus thermophilus TaxID=367743 RepID=A0A4P6UN97_9BACL|nr:HAMP domain-containing sensor histidine kinase [Ureibacillus thermophilus]QBK24463.1 HAMP domain-containing histidine kinase [Ureibacillus thermophilus]